MPQHNQIRRTSTPMKLGIIAALAGCAAWTPSAFAQSAQGIRVPAGQSSTTSVASTNDQSSGGQWSLGLGVVTIDEAYRDFDKKVYPLPVVSYENKWISATFPTLDVKLYSGESLSLRLRGRWVGDGYESKDSPVLAGMDERKASVWAGVGAIWKTDFATISGEVLTDAMSESKGTRAKLQIDRRFAAGKFGFTPRLAAEWVDDKYVDYYYGVRQSEVQAGRPFYEGKATTSMQVSLGIDYSLVRNQTIFFDVGYTRFGSSVKDSPLVDKPNKATLAVGYVYRF